jgi:large repetitive protein
LTNPGYSIVGNTITPNTNVTGNIVVRVSVSDGALNSNIYNLQVTVNPINDPPVITGQSTLTILEDTPMTFLLSHLTIVDPDNSSGFTFVLAPGSNYSVSLGNLITPAAHFNGTLSIPVTVSDGTNASAPYNLQIQVTPVNDKPQITGQTPISIAEVQPVTLDLSQLTVFDPDNNFPADFVLTISTGPNYSAVGNVVTPVVNFSGTLLVRIKVSDGSLESDYYDFQILVNSTNDPPVITGQRPLNTEENEPLQIQFVDLTVSDPDNTYPTGFTLTILPGTTYTFSGTTVTPNPNISGLIDVRVKVNDGSVDSAPYLLKIDVNSVNDAPVITGQLPMTALEDAPVINMSMGFLIISDPDSPISGFTMTVSNGAHYTLANGVEITPEANFYGTLSVPVKVNDGSLDSQPYNVQIQISPVNDAPTITGQNPLSAVEDQGITLKLEDFLVADIDNTFPTGFTLQVAQGSFPNYDALGTTVTPKDNFTGTLGVAVTVSDGAATSGTYNAAIFVGTINDPPTIDPIGNITIQEDPADPSVISLTGITAGVGEGGTQLVTVTISTNHPDWFEVFEVTYPGSTLGTLRIKPKADQTGTAQVTVRIQDDGLATPPHVNFYEYTFDFTIDPVNDAPNFTSQPLKLAETAQGFEYSIKVSDVENQALTITAPSLPTWLILTQGSNGQATLSGIPPIGTTGEVSVVIAASDPMGSVSTQEFMIVVNGRPTITPFAINTDEDKRFDFRTEFASNYNDPDGNPIVKIKIKQLPTKGKLFLGNTLVSLDDEIPANPLPALSYIPSTDSNGTDIIKWNATDGIYYSHLDANIVVSIIPFNDPPEVIALEAPETDTLKYELGSESPVKLTSIFDARDPEGDNIIAAEIGFQISTDYRDGKDIFSFRDTLGIVGAFIEELGVLTLTGKASVQDYVAAIRTVRYNYLDAVPTDDGLNRKVSIRLNDGNFGGTKERLIGLIYTNPGLDIANAFTPNGDDDNKYWRIYSPAGLERYKDALIRVYDKRGTLVYQATGFSTPWYGEGPEGVLPADSYYYTIDLRYDKKKYKGVVTILR